MSGHHAAVTHATDVAKERRIARRAKNLDVSAPFHCSLMAPAAQAVKDAITDVTLTPPVAPVVSNVTASPVGEDAASSGDWAGVAKRDLVTQVCCTIRVHCGDAIVTLGSASLMVHAGRTQSSMV